MLLFSAQSSSLSGKYFPSSPLPPQTSLISHFPWMTCLHTLQQKQKASEMYSSSHHVIHQFILTCSYFRGRGLLFNLRGASLSTKGHIYHMFLDFIPISILRIFVSSSSLLPVYQSLIGPSYQYSNMLSFELKTIERKKLTHQTTNLFLQPMCPTKPSSGLCSCFHSQASPNN